MDFIKVHYFFTIDYSNTVCCMCGSKKTTIKPNGRPHWYRYKIDGIWDGKTYCCKNCYKKMHSSVSLKEDIKNTKIMTR